jgi:hypothetical protein
LISCEFRWVESSSHVRVGGVMAREEDEEADEGEK